MKFTKLVKAEELNVYQSSDIQDSIQRLESSKYFINKYIEYIKYQLDNNLLTKEDIAEYGEITRQVKEFLISKL